MSIRNILRGAAAAACTFLAAQAGAQTFPEAHPIRIIVPFAPGGTVDLLARIIAEQIAKPLGQSVIVENRPGAGAVIGTDYVARADADGYTLLMASTSSLAINPNLQKLSYAIKDFAPIALVATVPHLLVVNRDVPVKNLQELLAYARQPGVNVTYATAGPGTPHHLAGALLNQMAGLHMTAIPYKGTEPALQDVIGGHVQLMSCDMPPALPFVNNGKVRVLGVTSKTRSPFAPNIPTIAEAGLPGFEVVGWYGVVAPARVPKNVIDKLSAVITQALAQPDARNKIAQIGATTAEGGTAASFGEFIHNEDVKWGAVIKKADIKLD
jgi:tripartite-type tricarboxylate transporter receptor subunit TctC